MDTKQRKRRSSAPAKRTASNTKAAPERRRRRTGSGTAVAAPERRSRTTAPAAPERRRRSAAPAVPDRAERQRRTAQRRQSKKLNPPANRRVVRPPREEVPEIIYTAPRPLRRGRFALRLLSMVAAVAAVFMALSVFFRVETIMVAGAEKYSPWMIRQASGIELGDALLSVSEGRVASRIQMKYPYVAEIKVGIRLPGTVEIEIRELQVTYAVADEGGSWWLVAADGRAVEQVDSHKAQGYTRIEGLTIAAPKAGAQVQAVPGQEAAADGETAGTQSQEEADEQLAALVTVMSALEKNRIIGEIALIDVTDLADIRLEYPQLLTVRLGDAERMDHKISYLSAIVEQLEDNQSGEIDLTLEYREEAIFRAK